MTTTAWNPPAPWRGLRRRPVSHPVRGTAWRAALLSLIGVPLGLLGLVALVAVLALGIALAPVGVGLGLLAVLPSFVGVLGRVERTLVRLVDPEPVPAPAGAGRGWRDPATWRELTFVVVSGALLAPAGAVVVAVLGLSGLLLVSPLVVLLVAPDTVMLVPDRVATGPVDAVPFALAGLVGAVLGLYLATGVASVHVVLARSLLGSREDELGLRVGELTLSRSRLASAFEAERRRIERDLHDGTQQQLGAVLMTLGQLEHELAAGGAGTGENGDPDRVRTLLGRARTQAADAQQRLRAVIRGVHPPVLTDHGLVAALEEVRVGHDPPVQLELDVPRLPAAVESCAYFVVLEALTNAARHADAGRIHVRGAVSDDRLRLQITDDGRGGVDPDAGTGLHGLAERVAVLGGTVRVVSPSGGGTTVDVVI